MVAPAILDVKRAKAGTGILPVSIRNTPPTRRVTAQADRVLWSRGYPAFAQSFSQIPNAMASKVDVVATPVNMSRVRTEAAVISVPALLIPTQAAPIQHTAANAIKK